MATEVTSEEAKSLVKQEDVVEGTQIYPVSTTTPMVGYHPLEQHFGYVTSQENNRSETESYEEGPINQEIWSGVESDRFLEQDKERSGHEAANEINHLLDNNDVASIRKGSEDEYLVKVEMDQGADIVYRVSEGTSY
jgi:hypothetical protein